MVQILPLLFDCNINVVLMKIIIIIIIKIIEIVATRCHILRLKFAKFDFGWGSAPDPAGGAYSAPQTP